MADWGLYSALRGQDDWAVRRQDAALNLQAQQMLTAKAKQENKERMEMEAKLAEYQNSVQNLDVLKADQERVQQVEKESRQDIISGIAKYDGDVTKFMSSGGVLRINEYQQAILQSDEYKNAIHNKGQEALWQKDRADKDKFILSSVIELDDVDENGKPIKQKKQVTMEEQMALFNSGQINKISYGGSEKKVPVSAKFFKDEIKNANDPWSPDNYVTEMDVYNEVILNRGGEEQARLAAKNYGDGIRAAGTPEAAWRWGAGDPYKLMSLEESRRQFNKTHALNKRKVAAAERSARSGGQKQIDVMGNLQRLLLSAGNGGQSYSPGVAKVIMDERTTKLTGENAKSAAKWGANRIYTGDVFVPTGSSENNDLGVSKNIAVSNIVITERTGRDAQFININNENGTPGLYMIADVYGQSGDANFADIKSALGETSQPFKHNVNESAVDMQGNSGASAQILIPVDNDFQSLYAKIVYNQQLAITTKADESMLMGSNVEWYMDAAQKAQGLIDKAAAQGETLTTQEAIMQLINAGSYNAAASGAGGNAASELIE